MHKTTPRSVEDILASNIARLRMEAPRIVPASHTHLWRMTKEGRLRTFGNPESVHIDHLHDQYEKGFPLLDGEDAAA